MIEKKDSKNNDKTPFKDLEWICLKNAIRIILIIIFIVLSTILIFSVKNVVGISQDIDYEFKNVNYYNTTNYSYDDFINTRNNTIFTHNNYSTYSFINDTVGTRDSTIDFINFTNHGTASQYAEIQADYNGHYKIISMVDGGAGVFNAYHYIPNITSGYMEFFVSNSDSTVDSRIMFYDTGNLLFYLQWTGGGVRIVANPVLPLLSVIKNNVWYHVRIDFNCNTDTGNAIVNNVNYGSFNFLTGGTVLDSMLFNCGNVGVSTVRYNDFGFSWDTLGFSNSQNVIPEITTNSILEVDIFDFNRYNSFDNLNPIGSDTFSNWTEIDIGADQCNINYDFLDMSDRVVEMEHYAPDNDEIGIEKEFFDLDSGYFNVSWSVNFTTLESTNEYNMEIYSSDDTQISRVFFENTQLKYYDGTNEIPLYTGITTNETYELNQYINYIYDFSIIQFWINDVYESSYSFSLLDNDKDGLGKIKTYIDGGVISDMVVSLDYIGVYVNGTSISEEIGLIKNEDMKLYHYEPQWYYFNKYNFFRFNAIGSNFSFIMTTHTYIFGISPLSQLTLYDNYNGSYFFNQYNNHLGTSGSYVNNPIIWISFHYQFNIINNCSFDGIKLTDGINDYDLEFDYNYVDINDNYFYVIGNRLYFNLDFNSSSYEGISATFDIPNISTINASIVYNSYYSGVIKPYLCVNYTDLTTLIGYYDFQSYYTTTRYLLPQNLYIDKIIINCSDFVPYAEIYTNYINGEITGYIDSISFKFIRNIDYSLTVITLISGFIPLIVMFTPSIALYTKFGKKILIPSLILMSIICIVGSLIPLWLFSLLIVIFGYLLLVSEYEGGI